jgi:TolA-binding protein
MIQPFSPFSLPNFGIGKFKSFILGLRVIVLVSLFSLWGLSLAAQKNCVFVSEDAGFETAIQLYENQKFGAARHCFEEVIGTHKDPNSLVRVDAEYYSAICALELFNKDAEWLLKQFIAAHPESLHSRKAYFFLGKYNYRKKNYRKAIEYFRAMDVYDLKADEKPEFYFMRGYCYFELGEHQEQEKSAAANTENAKADFSQIKDVDTRYTHPALYYYSHIAYKQKNYETAQQGFLNLVRDENFGPIVPYYITQIYFIQQKYADAIRFATPLLTDTLNVKRLPEIARIIGESDYRTGKYAESIPFLKQYEKSVSTLTRPDQYELGYAFYKAADYDNAISYLQEVVNEKDSLTQNAYYHLADCYLKKDNKQGARTAFGLASRLSFDLQIRENALFCYAKLCYELSFNPFSESIRAFQEYMNLYPGSQRMDECHTYLVNIFMTTRNYKEALRSIESIHVLKDELKPAYQKIAYYRAVDFFNNAELDSAIRYFDKSLNYPSEKNLNALAFYWKGECWYRKKEYNKAIEDYAEFMSKPGAFSRQEYNTANYNTGYAFFELKDYENANLSFRKFVNARNNAGDKLTLRRIADAYIRAGDCYFIQRAYSSAIEYYAEAIRMKTLDVDYALYQRAESYGLLKNNLEKIADLMQLVAGYPKSLYSASARFELGKAYFQNDEKDEALGWFQKVVDEFPNSSFVNRSLSQIGLIYYNKKEDDNALAAFDKLIRKDRKSDESEAVLPIIRKIYVAKNDIAGLEKYFREISATLPESALDSAAYSIAKNSWMEGDCPHATVNYGNYIARFPDGQFVEDAYFYKAECDYKSGDLEQALKGYSLLLEKSRNRYTEQSLVNASAINYKRSNYQAALEQYLKLEELAENPPNVLLAAVGQMRCNYFLKKYDSAIQCSNKIITLEKVPAETLNEAHLTIARCAMELKNNELAFSEFQTLHNLAKGEMQAEAGYNIAYLYFLKNEFKESKTAVFDLVKNGSAYPVWITKALLLLADNYVALKDNFQAKHTLKTVIESSDLQDLVQQARDKLNRIVESEKVLLAPVTQEEPKVEFRQNGAEENKELFKETQQPTDKQITPDEK